jgi:dephospho-CoA kinase
MSKALLVGLTGGIGSGKTTVSRVFRSLGVPVYYADDRGKWLMANDAALRSEIVRAFGKESYHLEGNLNRSYLASRVFSNEEELKKLNALVHPAVGKDFSDWADSHNDRPYLIKEAALIFEAGSYKLLDRVISVSAAKDIRLERVLLRDLQRSKDQVLAIMAKQLSENERKRRSDFVIENSGKQLVIPQVLRVDEALRKSAATH